MSSLNRNRARIGASLIIACTASAGAAAQAGPVADCHAITGQMERLACYDRSSGRAADPANSTGPADKAEEPKRALATATAPAPSRTSMIDAAWDFDPSTPRYALGLYRPTYKPPELRPRTSTMSRRSSS